MPKQAIEWQTLNNGVYEEYERQLAEDDTDIFGYDIAVFGVMGPKVTGWTIDHDAQTIILDVEVTE